MLFYSSRFYIEVAGTYYEKDIDELFDDIDFNSSQLDIKRKGKCISFVISDLFMGASMEIVNNLDDLGLKFEVYSCSFDLDETVYITSDGERNISPEECTLEDAVEISLKHRLFDYQELFRTVVIKSENKKQLKDILNRITSEKRFSKYKSDQININLKYFLSEESFFDEVF